MISFYIGYDEREVEAFEVCAYSLAQHCSVPHRIIPLNQDDLRKRGLYSRPLDEPASTQFTFTRFLVPFLNKFRGTAIFCDCDFLFTRDIAEVLPLLKKDQAIACVKHDYIPKSAIKMDGQKQVAYPRKNWSSFVLWNCEDPVLQLLTPERVSLESGAFLHRFEWIPDEKIGGLPLEWNWLEGEYEVPPTPPAVIHFTNGGPWFSDYQDVAFGDLWKTAAKELEDRKRSQLEQHAT